MYITRINRRFLAAPAAVVVMAALAACGGGSNSGSASSNTGSGSSSSSSGSKSASLAKQGTIIVGDASVATAVDPDGPAATDPENLDVENNAYDGLVLYKYKANPSSLGGGEMLDASSMAPGLATSWKTTPTGTTFTLRHGVKDSYGHTFTTADVLYTYQRNMALDATGKFILTVNGKVTGIKIDGPYKFTYETSGVAPVMLAAFASAYEKPVDATEVKAHATKKDPWAKTWLASHTAGFGPYNLTTFVSGKSVVLTPNPNYWGGKKPDVIKMVPIPSASSRLAAIQQGAINLAVGLTPQQEHSVASDSSVHLFQFNGNDVLNLYPNEKLVPAAKNQYVRQAMEDAIPTAQIIKDVYLGYAFNPKSIVPPYDAGFTSKYWPYAYSIAKAKALMAKGGYPNGFTMQLFYASESATLAQVAPIIQASFAQIGIKLKLVAIPQNELLTRTFGARNMDSFLVDLAANVPPALANVGGIWTTGEYGNDTNYSNKQFDTSAAAANNTLNVNSAADQQMQKVIAVDPPTIMMAGLQTVAVASSNVQGYSWTPEGSINFDTLTVSGN